MERCVGRLLGLAGAGRDEGVDVDRCPGIRSGRDGADFRTAEEGCSAREGAGFGAGTGLAAGLLVTARSLFVALLLGAADRLPNDSGRMLAATSGRP